MVVRRAHECVSQGYAIEFAVGIARDVRLNDDAMRHHVAGQALLAPRQQRSGEKRRDCRHDDQRDRLAERIIGYTHGGDFGNKTTFVDDFLDFFRANPVAGTLDLRVVARNEIQKAVRIASHEVPRPDCGIWRSPRQVYARARDDSARRFALHHPSSPS